MILFSKKFIHYEIGIIVCFIFLFFLMSKISPDQSYWLANIFQDKLFLYILLPIYLMGDYFIDCSVSVVQIVRMKSRRNGLFYLVCQKLVYACTFMTMWFVLFLLFYILNFNEYHLLSVVEIIHLFLKYLGGIFMVSNLITNLRFSNKKALRDYSYLLSYGLFIIDVTITSEANVFLPKNIYICFSWMFSDYKFTLIVIAVLNILFFANLLRLNRQKDYL